MRKVRWGILSTANIGVNKVIPGYAESRALRDCCNRLARFWQGTVCRPLSPDSESTQLLRIAGCGCGCGRNLQPASQSPARSLVDQSARGWQARVMREANRADFQRGAATCCRPAGRHPHLKVMEAFMYRHHPQWCEARRLVDDGRIGDLRTIHSFFSYFIDDPANLCNSAEYGGGGLMDIGCYPISLSRFLFGPTVARAGNRRIRSTVSYRSTDVGHSGFRFGDRDVYSPPRNSRLISASTSLEPKDALKLRFRSTHRPTSLAESGTNTAKRRARNPVGRLRSVRHSGRPLLSGNPQ